jgi:hypothetical protein
VPIAGFSRDILYPDRKCGRPVAVKMIQISKQTTLSVHAGTKRSKEASLIIADVGKVPAQACSRVRRLD